MLIVCLFLMGNVQDRHHVSSPLLSEPLRPPIAAPFQSIHGEQGATNPGGRRRATGGQAAAGGRPVAAAARLVSDGRQRSLGPAPPAESWREEIGETELDTKSVIWLVCWREAQYRDGILAKWLAKIEFG